MKIREKDDGCCGGENCCGGEQQGGCEGSAGRKEAGRCDEEACGGCGCGTGGEAGENSLGDGGENAEMLDGEECTEAAAEDGCAEAAAGAKPSDSEEEALNVKYMRLMADFQNYRRRTEQEKLDTYAYANEKIVGELLNVIDNFERALAVGSCEDGFAQGMAMIFSQLQAVLDKSGVKEIESLGQDFDPNYHNAVMMEEGSDYESGKVSDVLQKGYTLNGKVVRPAMVKVAS